MNTHRKLTAKTAGAICSLFTILCTSNLHAETTGPLYTMNAIADAAQGDRILAGDYEEAIDKIDMPDRTRLHRFYAATNLCVAYALARDLDKAESVCDVSVSVMQTRLAGKRLSRSRNYLKFLAIALSNRGVVNALGGDRAAAREDFNAALDVNARLKAPKINLARLNSDGGPNA